MVSRLVQRRKAAAEIEVTLSGRTTSFNAKQSKKALHPIEVT